MLLIARPSNIYAHAAWILENALSETSCVNSTVPYEHDQPIRRSRMRQHKLSGQHLHTASQPCIFVRTVCSTTAHLIDMQEVPKDLSLSQGQAGKQALGMLSDQARSNASSLDGLQQGLPHQAAHPPVALHARLACLLVGLSYQRLGCCRPCCPAGRERSMASMNIDMYAPAARS